MVIKSSFSERPCLFEVYSRSSFSLLIRTGEPCAELKGKLSSPYSGLSEAEFILPLIPESIICPTSVVSNAAIGKTVLSKMDAISSAANIFFIIFIAYNTSCFSAISFFNDNYSIVNISANPVISNTDRISSQTLVTFK